MKAQLSVFPLDRSQRWILAPGAASTRQIQIRNDSDAQVECRLSVDEPSAASVSPNLLTIPPRHTRTANVILLANWSPERDQRVVVSLRDAQANLLARFSQRIAGADISDCSVALDWKDPILLDGSLAGFKLWCSIANCSALPRSFEVEFTKYPALRFPERKTVTLAPGESAAFEVPVEWNRSVRDIRGWNHPHVIEAWVPVTEGRRAAQITWDSVEKHLDRYLTAEDREQKVTPVEPIAPPRRPALVEKTPGQLKYQELVELKRLEQGVVGAPQSRPPINASDETQRRKAFFQRVAPLATTGIALLALAVAFFYLRPPEPQPVPEPLRVAPLALSSSSGAHVVAKPPARSVTHAAAAAQAARAVEQAAGTPAAAVLASKEVSAGKLPPPKHVALAPQRRPEPVPAVDRNAVVALEGVDANYTAGGRAVHVAWRGTAQASATVQLLNDRGVVVASRSVPGSASAALVRLPRGYRGPVYVEVIAIGYHGERVVQSASLASGG